MPLLIAIVLVPSGSLFAAGQVAESRAIREIERLGGVVERDDKLPGRPVIEVSFRLNSPFGDEDSQAAQAPHKSEDGQPQQYQSLWHSHSGGRLERTRDAAAP